MEENKKKLSYKIIGFLLMFVTILITYGFTLGIKGLIVKEYSVIDKDLPNSFYGLKVVHFSDLHYGRIINKDNIESVIDKINGLDGDIVVFTGDLVDRDRQVNTENKNILIENLSQIKSTYGNYFVGGNHDKVNKSFYEIMENSNFINLETKLETIYKDESSISLLGMKSNINTKFDSSYLDEYVLSKYNIFLMHEPDNMKNIKEKNYDLLLAGHSHNGQVRLPIIGSIITPEGAKAYSNEYYKVNNSNLFISSGIGTSVLDIRLFNKPSINLYRLVNK